MRLKENIYEVISLKHDDNRVNAVIRLKADSDIYAGHFPGNPITPGVVMMGIARELLEIALDRKMELFKAPSIKYTAVLSPSEHATATYDITYTETETGDLQAKVNITDNSTTFARMSLVMQEI